jgi:mRNA interferase MazF
MELLIERGNIVICALSGDYGKPRPAVVIQSDLFNPTHHSITLCPITSHLIDAPLFRISLTPSDLTGITLTSQIMIDKVTTIKLEKITKKIGKISSEEMVKLNDALKLWLLLKS